MPALDLTDSDTFLEITIDGAALTVDLAKAMDELRKIDNRHAADPWNCGACGRDWTPSADHLRMLAEKRRDGLTIADVDKVRCPACSSDNANPPQEFLDDVASLLVKWGAKRCGRFGAAAFYTKATGAMADLKKNSTQLAESPTGTA